MADDDPPLPAPRFVSDAAQRAGQTAGCVVAVARHLPRREKWNGGYAPDVTRSCGGVACAAGDRERSPIDGMVSNVAMRRLAKKKVCAIWRNRACATRNPTPQTKVFFSRRSSHRRARRCDRMACRAAWPTRGARMRHEKNARFTDVFFHAHVSGSRRGHPPSPRDGGSARSLPPCRREGRRKKVARRC